TLSWLAALAMLPDCATASRICRSLSLMRRPIRSSQRMGLSVAKMLRRCTIIELFRYVECWQGRTSSVHSAVVDPGRKSPVTKRLWATAVAVLGSALAAAIPAAAQDYPQRPIRIVIDRPAGVPHDLLTRALADKLSASLKQPIVVDNRTGAGG